ncbi:hypothetical protein ONE63_005024 [Megalurothrips usitatus]|uniref:Cationic amino acid transporter C-terminal domain-containing protein n=1 Tax=Megalurothrips usitatus TaxID=439358 RepID=A0AAV7X4Q0_9NEOP|nr:hypothetical protein ONE63_005024 [Megalurothrips usitatus]
MDLTLLGVGSTLGLGVYVLAGKVANDAAGPAVVLSFIIAAIASLFAGVCYGEFAARVPKAGSAYVYAYVAVGEVVAFVIGWTLILEFAIGTASVTRGVSTYVDNLLGDKILTFFNSTMPFDVPTLADYPDFFSLSIIIFVSCLLAFGVKESSIANNILTFLNLGTATIAVVTAAVYANSTGSTANPTNWVLPARPGVDAGGFMPYGIKGIIAGASTCFYGFVGFDCIATTSEEAKNPRRNIPLSIGLSLAIITITYTSIAVVLTLLKPYYELDKASPFTVAFGDMELDAIKWIVTIGAIFALTTSLLGSMVPLPRIMYAMAQDGLLFSGLARVNDFTRTPLVATAVSCCLSGVLVLLFDLEQLIDMMSIGTLLAYTVVCMCVLVLRSVAREKKNLTDRYTDMCAASAPGSKPLTLSRSVAALVNWERAGKPSALTSRVVAALVTVQTLLTLALCVVMNAAGDDLYADPASWLAYLLGLFVPLVVVVIMLGQQPQADVSHLSFKVPGLPYLPAVSLVLNLYLMAALDVQTWTRFAVWMVVGEFMYICVCRCNPLKQWRSKSEMTEEVFRGGGGGGGGGLL